MLGRKDQAKIDNSEFYLKHDLIQNQMALIDSSEFDIFSLNDMEKDKTTFLVANEILSNTDVVKEGIVPNDILEKFIQTVLSGYDRINVLYHNDLKMYLYPGGHVDDNDNSILSAAEREVKEETGLVDFKLLILTSRS